MKEKKLLGKEQSSEEEKSRVEQIEEEIKQSVFSVFYLLLKNHETTYWKFIFLLIIEYLQLLSFSFNSSVKVILFSVGIDGCEVEINRDRELLFGVPGKFPRGLLVAAAVVWHLRDHFLHRDLPCFSDHHWLHLRSHHLQAQTLLLHAAHSSPPRRLYLYGFHSLHPNNR